MTTIRARFDGSVFVPEEPVDLPQGRAVQVQVEDNLYPLLALLQLAEEGSDDPDSPPDLAAQHDHYLHGVPKRVNP